MPSKGDTSGQAPVSACPCRVALVYAGPLKSLFRLETVLLGLSGSSIPQRLAKGQREMKW